MANRIIKQPNGKYCIFSTIVDNITYYDMTKQEIIDAWVNEEKERIIYRVTRIINDLNEGKEPYHQFTISLDKMVEIIRSVHGDIEAEEIKKLIKHN